MGWRRVFFFICSYDNKAEGLPACLRAGCPKQDTLPAGALLMHLPVPAVGCAGLSLTQLTWVS